LGGAVSINRIRNTTDAHLRNVADMTLTSTADDSIAIHAEDKATIRVAAGGIGIAVAKEGGAAVGAGVSVAFNEIDNSVTAYIADSEIVSDGGVSLLASEAANIEALTLGAAAGVSTGGGGLAGSGAG